MSLTTDPKHPKLGRGGDTKPGPQNEVYLVLSDEEKAKGYVRPVRRSYVHVGKTTDVSNMRVLTEDEKERYKDFGYIGYVSNDDKDSPIVGTFITESSNTKGCGVLTTMGISIAETYARNPKFYGSTYCLGCKKHIAVDEFVWDDGTEEKVGS